MKPVLRDVPRRRLHRREWGGDVEQADGSDVVSTLAATLLTSRDAIETVTMSRQRYPAPIGFYHPGHTAIGERACAGLTCSVTRVDRPDRWQTVATQTPALYRLSKCYDAPSDGAHDARPHVGEHVCQTVLLGNVLRGDVRDLPTHCRDGAALEKARQMASQTLLNMMEVSRLQRRGGTAFPAGTKWQAIADAYAETKYAIVNADEGDPDVFSDRFLLEDDPFRLIEAIAVAAYAVDARRGYIYIRGGYPDAVRVMPRALEQARAVSWLGLTLKLELVVGRGAHICREETSLLNALEGCCPEVRPRPPQISERGLFGVPTLVHSVKTPCATPRTTTHGAAAYVTLGLSNSRGTKLLSLNSLFCRPGLHEVESGISLVGVVEQLGQGLRRGKLNGLMVGGPLVDIVPSTLLDTRLDYEEMQAIDCAVGYGGVIAFADDTSIPRIVVQVLRFGAREPCGKCTLRHLGMPILVAMTGAAANRSPVDADRFRRSIDALAATSLCGHGRGLAELVQSVCRHYPSELQVWCD